MSVAGEDQCPICRMPAVICEVPEKVLLLVECPLCSTFTITLSAARTFASLGPEEIGTLRLLSRYLRQAGDDDDREVTEQSWLRLAAKAPPEWGP